ncbi:hypothetical protein [Saccharospirillum sp.]|uniref:hypothetical protein n=1 Tax=Saccharospirillum sp. TaxID=2033801 RepID=UPI0034A055B5
MSKRKKLELSEKKAYRKRIRRLCYRVLNGDLIAEKNLDVEQSNPDARKIISQVIKSAKKAKLKAKVEAKKVGIPAANVKSKNKLGYGNAYKPFQGGSPGIGKNS